MTSASHLDSSRGIKGSCLPYMSCGGVLRVEGPNSPEGMVPRRCLVNTKWAGSATGMGVHQNHRIFRSVLGSRAFPLAPAHFMLSPQEGDRIGAKHIGSTSPPLDMVGPVSLVSVKRFAFSSLLVFVQPCYKSMRAPLGVQKHLTEKGKLNSGIWG